jgi:glycosyltransferase involved in cell wall biosynthesis
MKLAVDGGAFQQGIAAGILNVAVGLLNAIKKARPETIFFFVADPRIGPVRQDLLELLSFTPHVIYAPIGPVYGDLRRRFLIDDPNIRFEVDGEEIAVDIVNGEIFYNGPAPTRSFKILSRADKPSLTRGGGDDRILGIFVQRIGIQSGASLTCIDPNMIDQSYGFHNVESAGRWTNGVAELPIAIFPGEGRSIEVKILIGATMTYRVGGGLYDESFARIVKRATGLELRIAIAQLEDQLRNLNVDSYLSNHFLPATFPNLRNYAILYDMIPVLSPEFFFQDARDNFQYNIQAFKAADHIFSISENSRQDLIRTAHVHSDCVTSMMIDIDTIFTTRPNLEVEETRRRYGLAGRPYMIMVGTLEPRKNHARLIEAFHALKRGDAPACDLVFVGKPGWGTDGLVERVRNLGLSSEVHFLPNVPNSDLAALYSGALFTAYPSLYEGFGLPVLEAMACGCPVMTSDRSSMPEIAGDAAVLVDPTSVASILQGLYRLITNEKLRAELSTRGLKQREKFGWDVSAARVLKIIGTAR